jgi:hypothetical protein
MPTVPEPKKARRSKDKVVESTSETLLQDASTEKGARKRMKKVVE